MPPGRFTLVRHGQSTYNAEGLVNGDPSVPVYLTDLGVQQARATRNALVGRDFDLAVRTRFVRTAQTLDILLDGADIPIRVYKELDDVRLGIFESRPVGEYREWRRTTTPGDPPPGEGESRLDALYRYMRGFERLRDEDAERVLACLHDVPIRFMANAVRDADPLDGPVRDIDNGEIVELDGIALARGIAVMGDRLGL